MVRLLNPAVAAYLQSEAKVEVVPAAAAVTPAAVAAAATTTQVAAAAAAVTAVVAVAASAAAEQLQQYMQCQYHQKYQQPILAMKEAATAPCLCF